MVADQLYNLQGPVKNNKSKTLYIKIKIFDIVIAEH